MQGRPIRRLFQVLPVTAGLFYSEDFLARVTIWVGIDEAQRDQEPDQRRDHVDHRHRVDRLPGAHAGGEDRIIERHDQRLAAGTGGEEGQLEHRDGPHQHQQQRGENAGRQQRQQHMEEQPAGAGAEHPRRGLDARIDLLDERDHHQHDERHGRHEIGENDAGDGAAEMRLIEHGRQRNAEGDRRDQHRQQEQQDDESLAREIAARQRVGRRHAEQPRQQHDGADDLEGHDQDVVELEFLPGRGVPARGVARRQPGAEPARPERIDDDGRDHARRD